MRHRGIRAGQVLLLSILGAFALAMGYRWLERGGTFDLETVRVRGARSQDSVAVCSVVAPLFGTSIWRIDGDSLSGVLGDVPGVRSASVRRLPFTGMLISIELERVALAIRDSVSTVPLSIHGERLPESFLSDSVPIVFTSVEIDDVTAGRLAEWLGEVTPGGAVNGMVYSGDGLAVMLDSGCTVLLGKGGFRRGWEGYTALSSATDGLDEWDLVDMRFQGQAVLRETERDIGQGGEGS